MGEILLVNVTLVIVNQCAKNGKALEYEIAKQLMDCGARGLDNTMGFQARDRSHFATRPQHLRSRFVEASKVIVTWILEESGGTVLTVRRMEDVSGGVADLVVVGKGDQATRLSIKHNHDALKHPRPYSLAQACGFRKASAEDIQHRTAMDVAATAFRFAAKRQKKSRYIELPIAKAKLYCDVVDTCAGSIGCWESKSGIAAPLFQFFVGAGFKKLIVSPEMGGAIELQDFTGIARPAKVLGKRTSDLDRLELTFDNRWVLDCRLHTAATKISPPSSQLSLKFDVRRVQGSAPTQRLA